jgi:hypothetical protein
MKIRKEHIELEFKRYFEENQNNSYSDFQYLYNAKFLYKISLNEVKTVARRLQRNGILTCVKLQDTNGRFYSKKTINK